MLRTVNKAVCHANAFKRSIKSGSHLPFTILHYDVVCWPLYFKGLCERLLAFKLKRRYFS